MPTIRGILGTKKPTGLTITRNGAKFTTTWKITDVNYGSGQQYQRRVHYETATGAKKATDWSAQTLTNRQTKEATTLTWSDYYPTTERRMTSLEVRIKGRRGVHEDTSGLYPGKLMQEPWSAWAYKEYTITPPLKPSLSANLDDELWNKTNFSWSYTDETPIHRPFIDIEYQSILVKDCTETNGEKLKWSTTNVGWRTGTTGATGSLPIAEDTALIAGKSYTRWVRIRSRGPGGPSAWVYRKHVYALPYAAIISEATAKQVPTGIQLYAKWEAPANAAHPIDFSIFQYLVANPAAGLTPPAGETWEDALTLADTAGADAASYIANIAILDNEALWVRVNSQHDEQLITEGEAQLVMVGRLSAPENVAATTDPTRLQATITADNTAESDVPDSFLAITYQTASNPAGAFVIGVIPHGQRTTTVQCPDFTGETVAFGVYAVQGTYTAKTRADGVTQYAITANMTSETVYDGGTIPAAPGLTGAATETEGTIQLSWDWTWDEATGAELSWADHADAWESTDEPDTYEVPSIHTAQWRVAGLTEGRLWFFRVRLYKETTDGETVYGSYSDIIEINLSSAPLIPALELSQTIITEEGQVTASWAYISTDGTQQAVAELCEYNNGTYSAPIATTETAQHVTLYAADHGWSAGDIIALCVRVTSASGQQSEWSEPVPVTIAEPLNITVTTNLQDLTIDGETVKGLTALPLTVTVTGAGAGGTTTVALERLLPYYIDRPDETTRNGYAGETIALITQTGEGQITIDRGVLIGDLDDGAYYNLIATVQDGYGQTAEEQTAFIIQWAHQAVMPEAEIVIDTTERAAIITPKTPEGALTGDAVDIYRLSADRPELIYPGAAFETAYVDPYPAIGNFGGYRIVYKTYDGDYITEEQQPAWTDYEAGLNVAYSIIDFGGEYIPVLLDQNISSSWTKDFKETQYLGGAITGDWNRAVARTGTVGAYIIKLEGAENIRKMRRLAAYTGICHVRTVDGSSYAADVQVSEQYDFDSFAAQFNLKITRVDPEGYDAIPKTEWEASS